MCQRCVQRHRGGFGLALGRLRQFLLANRLRSALLGGNRVLLGQLLRRPGSGRLLLCFHRGAASLGLVLLRHLLRRAGLLCVVSGLGRILPGVCFLSRRFPLGTEGKHKRHQRSHRDDCDTPGQVTHPPGRPLLQRRPLRLGRRQRLSLFQLTLTRCFPFPLGSTARHIALIQERHRRLEAGRITLRPGRRRAGRFTPAERDLQVRIVVQARPLLAVQTRRLRQPAINPSRLCLCIHPVFQPRPDTHQTLVRDVDDRIRFQGNFARRHQERHARIAVGFHHLFHLVQVRTHNLRQLIQTRRAADTPVVDTPLRQRLEHALGHFTRRFVQAVIDLVSVPQQSLFHPANVVIMPQLQRLLLTVIRHPAVKRPHQSVLQHR